jgi:hypothetical protein
MDDSGVSVIGAILSFISLIVGVWTLDGVMVVASLLTFLFCITMAKCGKVHKLALIASITVLICTVLMATVASYETMVDDGTSSKSTWTYVAAVIHAVPMIPVTLLTFYSIAAFSRASYNWVIVCGLGPFIGLGIQGIGYALTYPFVLADFQIGPTENAYVLYGLMFCMIFLIAFYMILKSKLKKGRLMITSNGLEVIQ